MNTGCEWFNNETANVIIGSFPFIQSHLVIAWVVGGFTHSGFISVTLLGGLTWGWPASSVCAFACVCVCAYVPSQPEPPPVFPVLCLCWRCPSVKTWLCLSGRPAVSLYPSADPAGSLSTERDKERETHKQCCLWCIIHLLVFTPQNYTVLACVSTLTRWGKLLVTGPETILNSCRWTANILNWAENLISFNNIKKSKKYDKIRVKYTKLQLIKLKQT